MITLNNIQDLQKKRSISVVKKARVVGRNSKPTYSLLEPLTIQLSNKKVITIPKGFEWDGSSAPRLLWAIVPPDGDFELGALIHDYLYVNKKSKKFADFNTRKFADKEMLIWSRKCSGTSYISIRNVDNIVRYIMVRIFGGLVWKDIVKIK